ncbi:MAG: lipoprotein [Alphaproteobacteria bacterium]|nr:lipoprotein [Alphaproteobacteria bacterium]
MGDRRRLILALGACAALLGCGKKGDLELPPPDAIPGDQPAGDDSR